MKKSKAYYDAVSNLAMKASKGELKGHILEEIIWDISQSFEIDNTETIVQDMMKAYGDKRVSDYKDERDLDDRIAYERSM